MSIANDGRGDGEGNDDNGDGVDDNGDGDKTHTRLRPRSPTTRVFNNKLVRIPPSLSPLPLPQWKPLIVEGMVGNDDGSSSTASMSRAAVFSPSTKSHVSQHI